MVFPVQRGDDIRITYAGSTAPTNVRARFQVVYDDGSRDELAVRIDTFTTDRTPQSAAGTEGGATAKRAGTIVSGIVGFGGDLKRGQFYVTVDLFRDDEAFANLCRDYIYALHTLPLGVFVPPGPGGGEGFLDWVQVANDVAGNVDTTVNLAVANAHVIYRAVLLKYHSDGNTASRTPRIQVIDLADTSGPTGFSIQELYWSAPGSLTLTANEEGIIFAGQNGFFSFNDNATIDYDSRTLEPTPFPLTVEEGETGDIFFNSLAGLAGDRYDAWIQREEWIAV